MIPVGNDALLAQAWNAIGDYYADRQKWLVCVCISINACVSVLITSDVFTGSMQSPTTARDAIKTD